MLLMLKLNLVLKLYQWLVRLVRQRHQTTAFDVNLPY
jgi:hypothetical protein